MENILNRIRYLNECYDKIKEPWRLLVCIALVMPAAILLPNTSSQWAIAGSVIWIMAVVAIRMLGSLGWRR